MFGRSVFFLHKGPLLRDSRSHIGLAHELRVDRADETVAAGQPLSIEVFIKNTGTASWLHQNSQIFGIVRLGSHLFRADGGLISIDHSRHDLPERVDPGSATRLVVGIRCPVPANTDSSSISSRKASRGLRPSDRWQSMSR